MCNCIDKSPGTLNKEEIEDRIVNVIAFGSREHTLVTEVVLHEHDYKMLTESPDYILQTVYGPCKVRSYK